MSEALSFPLPYNSEVLGYIHPNPSAITFVLKLGFNSSALSGYWITNSLIKILYIDVNYTENQLTKSQVEVQPSPKSNTNWKGEFAL